ncbi:MAG: hypothetical protein ABIR91_01695, partial [Candidatus Saccharimonadales bacterium]
MSEKLPFHLDLPALPDRRQLVEHYIGTLTDRDRGAADNIAAQLYNPERALADCQVLIPVAAHQESTQIQNTLAQYAHQQTDQPFSVILSLNSPATEQLNPGVNDTLQQIELARAAHPDLDLRTALTFYDTPTIGLIRRDLWNGALIASTYSGAYDDPN